MFSKSKEELEEAMRMDEPHRFSPQDLYRRRL